MQPPRGPSPDALRGAPRPWWALIVAAVALAGVGALLARTPSPTPPHNAVEQMVAVAPGGVVDIGGLPSDHR